MSSLTLHETAKNYAEAFFQVVEEKGQINEAGLLFTSLNTLIKKTPSLKRIFQNPLLSGKEQEKILLFLTNNTFSSFFLLIIRKNRLKFLPDIIEAFLAKVHSYKKQAHALIETPEPLSSAQKEALLARLTPIAQGKELSIEEKINPHLLGGTRITIDGKILDLSLATYFQKLSQERYG